MLYSFFVYCLIGDREPWNWHGDQNNDFGASEGAWTQVTLNEEDLSYMFVEATPVKECGDLSYHVTQNDDISKESEEKRETASQVKRRRMLQFDTHAVDSSLICEEMPSAFLKSRERDDMIEEILPDASEWVAGLSEDASASSYDGLDQSCEGWLAEYFNDPELLLSSDDMNLTGASNVQIDTSELCNAQPESGADAVQKQATRTLGNVVLKGRKSFIRMPPKVASSVAYPFAFIKPCGFHGDVTLKDINQRIRTPPPSKSKQSNEDLADAFPTSAFSGKPVVGKTKIRTEGGKGTITIMRTKG
ncbi:protein XRI1-like [Gossypium australe]|uniref:Protein XRI1-like n=1 Tax=Gossypium australe TaxID=47621 RepID=A0A5B6UPW5_9ROSI|nr:protein XRI1-like [Gossypium australe]